MEVLFLGVKPFLCILVTYPQNEIFPMMYSRYIVGRWTENIVIFVIEV